MYYSAEKWGKFKKIIADFGYHKEYSKNGIEVKLKKYRNKRLGEDLLVPAFYVDGTCWMILTVKETESTQSEAIAEAKGHVAIAGVGIGWALTKLMLKKAVKSIDVYELDSRVINFFVEEFGDREGFGKIKFICGDVREQMVGKRYDFVYVDIYLSYKDKRALQDKKLLLNNNDIKKYMYWGEGSQN